MKNYLSLKDVLTEEELDDLTKAVCGMIDSLFKKKLWCDVYATQLKNLCPTPGLDASEAVEKYNKAWKRSGEK